MKNVHIAIADDHPLFRKGVIELIQKFEDSDFKYEVVSEASNSQQLLEHLEKTPFAAILQVVLLDLTMPGKSGLDTIPILRSRYPNITIIVMTMRSDDESIIRSLRLGASGYIGKDAEPHELKNAIDASCKKGFYLAETVSSRLIRQLIDPATTASDLTQPVIELNNREREFLQLSCSDLTYSRIAEKMNISVRTVDGYREGLFAKLRVSSRVGLALWAIKNLDLENINQPND